MAIAAAAIATPPPRPIKHLPIVDPETGVLTQTGHLFLQQLHGYVAGTGRSFPCNVSGTNVLSLTLAAGVTVLSQYNTHDVFSFVAANSSTGSVTAAVTIPSNSGAPSGVALATVKVFKSNGAAQAGNGDITAGRHYQLAYVDSLDSGNGGLVLR